MHHLIFSSLFIIFGTHDGFSFHKSQDSIVLKLHFDKKEPIMTTDTNLLLNIYFQNKGLDTVRLLNEFEPLGTFFYLKLHKDSTYSYPLRTLGGTLAHWKLNYILIPPNQYYVFVLDFHKLLIERGILSLQKGMHHLSINYENNHGDQCIRGPYEANLDFTVE